MQASVNKKLSYYRGTVQCAVLVNSCAMFHNVWQLEQQMWPSRSFKGIGNGAMR